MSENTVEEDLLEEINNLRDWAVGCKSMQADKAHDARKAGDKQAAARFEGRRETYYTVEELLVEKVLPLAERVAEGSTEADSHEGANS